MINTKSVSLQDEAVVEVGDIRFVRAEWVRDVSPFVLIRYTIAGTEQPTGIALDMNKKVFLPDVQNEILHDRRVRQSAQKVWDVVVKKRGLTLAL
jgi:hypothetical protein